ncbi:hypothetical protein CCHR01_09398 [Colletotrichum chrysophilum]|uniref:Uncharacterized protein n=1 Tax=Colletotrichum chrysophilum TaxID=1836956 RepID=A0AAD9EE73_9PEZI|nr:hypothetical protein CCHR01_09398 [Colletotrichum chrysophilum]
MAHESQARRPNSAGGILPRSPPNCRPVAYRGDIGVVGREGMPTFHALATGIGPDYVVTFGASVRVAI